ncbi:hypothetical protein [Rhizobium sp. L245/93]|uniref:hypothetical protein n=1 Tax=Rhizobium sp. L245/93 TaxID=2819998 RepID=UPI001ADBF723|nr:hypothetical protein [Rhizobium sp. L245/93]MBO9170886.1 hypothetical protein [Rhizobium sp. L245/93]
MSDVGKVLLGAVGALGIAWVNTRLGIWRDERSDERKRKGALVYSMALVESTLRRYARDCLAVANDDGEPVNDRDGEYEDWRTLVPEPTLVYLDKIDWTLFDESVLFNALAIPVIELRKKRESQAAYDAASLPYRYGFIEARQLSFSRLAMFTANVLADFHKYHPAKFTSDQRELIDQVSKRMTELEDAAKKLEEDNAGWIALGEKMRAEKAATSTEA